MKRILHPIYLRQLWADLLHSLWFVPTLMALLALLLSSIMPWVDSQIEAAPLEFLFGGGPVGARIVLSTIAGSMITVAGVVFSITIVALTLASSQFGPRLLRNFMRDTGNQVVLGTFIATFLYCLSVLTKIRAEAEATFVPHLSITVAMIMAICSIGVLIYFMHHISMSIQAQQVISNVSVDLENCISRLFPEPPPEPTAQTARMERSEDELPEFDGTSFENQTWGYLQRIDLVQLVKIAQEQDVVFRLDVYPGDFCMLAYRLATASKSVDQEVQDEVRACFVFGQERTLAQDSLFSVTQLVEVALRALSPGINDPSTASVCVQHLAKALHSLTEREFPPPYRFDENDTLRLVAKPRSFSEWVTASFSDILWYGRSHPCVVRTLFLCLPYIALNGNNRKGDHLACRRALDEYWEIVRTSGDLPDPIRSDLETVYKLAARRMDARQPDTMASDLAES